MPVRRIGDIDLFHECHGEGAAVVFIPGLGGSAQSWSHQVGPFAGQFKVVLHDHRGTNRSGRTGDPCSIEQLAGDVVHLMDELGIERGHLVGHSTGGVIAQTIAVDHGDRVDKLVLVSSWAKADAFFRYVMGNRLAVLRGLGAEAYARATPYFLYPPEWISAHWPEIERGFEALEFQPDDRRIMASRIDAILAFDRSTELGRIARPCLVLCARNDILAPPHLSKELAGLIPGSRLEVLDRGAHACHQTIPEVVNPILLDFLATS